MTKTRQYASGATIVHVTLTAIEKARAVRIAKQRYAEDRKAGLGHKFGAPNSTRPDVVGAMCEAGFAKYMGVRHEKGNLGDYDVGSYQVRGTDGDGRCLLLHRPDRDDDVFVLVHLLRDGRLVIVGWTTGSFGKWKGWWDTLQPGRPCFCIPRHGLWSLASLPVIKKKKKKKCA